MGIAQSGTLHGCGPCLNVHFAGVDIFLSATDGNESVSQVQWTMRFPSSTAVLRKLPFHDWRGVVGTFTATLGVFGMALFVWVTKQKGVGCLHKHGGNMLS